MGSDVSELYSNVKMSCSPISVHLCRNLLWLLLVKPNIAWALFSLCLMDFIWLPYISRLFLFYRPFWRSIIFQLCKVIILMLLWLKPMTLYVLLERLFMDWSTYSLHVTRSRTAFKICKLLILLFFAHGHNARRLL